MGLLKGNIYVTDNKNVVYAADLNTTRIIDMSEMDDRNALPENLALTRGTCLLPPVAAKIAESDGNELLFDRIYSNHLLEPDQQGFITALIAVLYQGLNVLLFLPDPGYTNTQKKFIFHMYDRYGIHIGLVGQQDPAVANCYYDERCLPIWLNMMYSMMVLDPYEYLLLYPADAPLANSHVMGKLIQDINPYARTFEDKKNYIVELHEKIHKYGKIIRPAIHDIIRS